MHSILDDISGIGPTRRRALMKYFQSLEAIQSADIDEIMKVPAMNRQAAEEVYQFFHKDSSH